MKEIPESIADDFRVVTDFVEKQQEIPIEVWNACMRIETNISTTRFLNLCLCFFI